MCGERISVTRVCVKRSSNEVSHEGVNGKVGRERERERERAQVRCQKAFLSFLRKEHPLFRTRVTDRIGLQQVRLS